MENDMESSDLFYLLAGVVATWWGAESLVRGAVRLALYLGISPLIVGLTVVAFGTSSPEAVVSFLASARGVGGIALGNVLGSNIANVGLILGIATLLRPMRVEWNRLRSDVYVMLSVSLVAGTLLVLGWMGHVAGWIFLAVQVGLLCSYARAARRERSADDPRSSGVEEIPSSGSLPLAVAMVVGGLILLVLGAKWLVYGAENIALALGISEAVIGATMVAVGTSLPELAASVAAVLKGQHELGLGNVVGSNTMNLLFVLGGSSAITPLRLAGREEGWVLGTMLAFAGMLWVVLARRPQIGRREGALLLVLYFGFAARIYFGS